MTEPLVALPNLALAVAEDGRPFPELAAAVGLEEFMLSALVRGTTVPTPELEQRVATVLERDATWLFEVAEHVRQVNYGRRLEDPELGLRVATRARDARTPPGEPDPTRPGNRPKSSRE